MVAKLDPLPRNASPAAATRKQDIFERVVGDGHVADTDVDVSVTPIDAYKNRDRGRRRFAVPGAIAAAIIVVAGIFLVSVSRAPNAEAVVAAAAERSALVDSGRVEIAVDLREPVAPQGATFEIAYEFEGDDYRLDILGDGRIAFSEMQVAGVNYFGDAFAGGDLVWSDGQDSPFAVDFLPGLSAANARPETVLPLIELAEDFQKTSNDSGVVYRGAISRENLLAQPELPTGVAIVTSGADPASELPEMLVLEVAIVDDLIQQLVLLVEGDLPTGEFFSATVTTTYSEYGEPQNLIAPDVSGTVVALPSDLTPVPFWAPGPEPRIEADFVLQDLLRRRPGLCFEAGIPENPQPGQQVSSAEFKAAAVECLLSAGEPAAAAAVDDLPG